MSRDTHSALHTLGSPTLPGLAPQVQGSILGWGQEASTEPCSLAPAKEKHRGDGPSECQVPFLRKWVLDSQQHPAWLSPPSRGHEPSGQAEWGGAFLRVPRLHLAMESTVPPTHNHPERRSRVGEETGLHAS